MPEPAATVLAVTGFSSALGTYGGVGSAVAAPERANPGGGAGSSPVAGAPAPVEPYAVPLLGQKAGGGPFVGELREVLGDGLSSLVWACEHAHPDRGEAKACAKEMWARLAADAGGRGDG